MSLTNLLPARLPSLINESFSIEICSPNLFTRRGMFRFVFK